MIFAKYVTEKRLKANLSQGDVAKAMGYSTNQFVSNWERSLCYPPIEDFEKLSTILNVDLKKFTQKYIDCKIDKLKQSIYAKINLEV